MSETSRSIHEKDSVPAQSPKEDHVRQRYSIYIAILVEGTQLFENQVEFHFCLSPQTNEQTKRTKQILVDILRAYALQFGIRVCHMLSSHKTTVTRRVSRLHLLRLCMDVSVEPCYFGIKQERQVFGPNVLRDAKEQVRMIRDNLRVAQS